jgi:RNA polymerase sigma factor (sigma-70 family)
MDGIRNPEPPMSQTAIQDVVERLRQAVEVEQTPDGLLLDAFVRARSEAAFAELVRRHGPMVWGVCWRLLSSRQDAEDCYQATFLVLVRKARSVWPRSRVGAWLHGVAYHTALKARLVAARRWRMEQQAERLPESASKPDPTADLRQLLDCGLNELPDKYRIPIVLCELEGRALKDVAEQLGSPIGTVAGWLARGRDLLARRLAKHGLSAVAIAALLAEKASAAPPVVSAATASPSVSALADATVRTLFFATLKSWLLITAAVLALTFALGGMYHVVVSGSSDNPPPGNVVVPPLAKAGFAPVQKKDAKVLITKETQKAIDAGLAYLAQEQADDGSWGTQQQQGSTAVTSLAGLAFLSGNHHPDRGEYGKTVTRAVRYVLSQEHKDTPGFFHAKGAAHGPMYNHGFAVLFLADAHAAIADKKLKTEVKDALDRAVKLTLDSQNEQGGWRYQPKPQDADLSVTAGQVAALRAARDAGIGVPQAALDKAIAYVKSCHHPDNGGYRYQPLGGPAGFARSAAGVMSLNRLGVKDGEALDNGMDYLRKSDLKNETVKMHYFYGHYYAAKAMWYAGDKDWRKWYPPVRDELLESRKEGNRWSSGNPADPHYCTAMALIILQMPQGHLASMRR